MKQVSTVTASENVQFDFLLGGLAKNLQLTATQFKDAEGKYLAAGSWLGADGSPIASFNPAIYPQGSMSLQTTVKPREQDEFDLDLVCLMNISADVDPNVVYRMVLDRLEAHEIYKKLLDPRPRCLRLNYARQFHLDIIPAIPDKEHGGTSVLIPARDLGKWKDSNPKAYVAWFDSRCRVVSTVLAKAAEMEPLPADDGEKKACLRLSTQLWKRHRDIAFEDRRKAPSSIVLTTLLGDVYEGYPLCSDTLIRAFDRIATRIEGAKGVMQVLNPANPGENLTADWDDRFYRTFCDFFFNFRERMNALVKLRGLDKITVELEKLFGEAIAKKAVQGYMDRMSAARSQGNLRVNRSAATVTTAAQGTRILSNTFHGE